jgi:hypothetical protein
MLFRNMHFRHRWQLECSWYGCTITPRITVSSSGGGLCTTIILPDLSRKIPTIAERDKGMLVFWADSWGYCICTLPADRIKEQ